MKPNWAGRSSPARRSTGRTFGLPICPARTWPEPASRTPASSMPSSRAPIFQAPTCAALGSFSRIGTNVSKAQGFVAREPGGKFGPFAKALEALDKKSKMITADMLLETTLGDVGIRFEAYGGALRWHSTEGVPDCASNALGFTKMFRQFVEGWWPHTTGIKKLSTTGVKCPLKGEKLTEAVEAALVEVLGLASAGTPAPATPPARSAKKSPSKAAPKKRAKPRRAGR
jgi:hypothetical protein